MREINIQNEIRVDLGKKKPNCKLFRNNVGLGFVGTVISEARKLITLQNYRRVKYGLFVGSSDLIGFTSVKITPDLVGKTIAIFTSLETKRPGEKLRPDQENWISFVKKSGGIAGRIESTETALEVLNGQIGV